MSYEYVLTAEFSASPEAIFEAWLSSEGHTAMTGGVAHTSPEVGAAFDAWDGYISGVNLEIEPGARILQTWRTQHFPGDDPDSTIEIHLEAVPGGTRLTLTHSNVPDGQTSYEEGGWQSHYFEPMKRRFGWLERDIKP